MDWISIIPESIQYIENHITDDISVESVAKNFNISPFFFQKGFMIMCGYSVSEYIRNRRLSLAGTDLLNKENTITDIAMKYYYDSPDSFTKAFSRFHGATPTAVRKGEKALKTFAPLKVKIVLEGGYLLDYKIVGKEAFSIIGVSKTFEDDIDGNEINNFWNEVKTSEYGKHIAMNLGINIADTKNNQIKYLAAELYNPQKDYPQHLEIHTIPARDWVIFPCVGPAPETMMRTYNQIYTEWLPTLNEYEIDDDFIVEYYEDESKYEKAFEDKNYCSEIWFPIRKR